MVRVPKNQPTGTIAIAADSDLRLGGVVRFDVTTQNIGNENPRIQLVCYQDTDGDGETDDIVCAEAHNVDGRLGEVPVDGPGFVLGSGSSQWKINGGSADCVATLYYWKFHPVQTFVPLASVTFSAGA